MNSVAVIIPVYNREDYLREALDSVFAQTRLPDEVIVVDDGSSDASTDVAASYPGVTLVRQANRGASEARNNGLRHATAEWVAFLDSDDAWRPEKLQVQMDALAAEPGYDVCVCNAVNMTGELPALTHYRRGQKIADELFGHLRIAPGCVLVKRQSVLNVGSFEDTAKPCEDWDLWLKLALAGSRFLVVPENLLLVRLHDSNISNQSYRMMKAEMLAWDRRIGPRFPAWARPFARRSAHSHFLSGVALVEREQKRPHLGIMAKSLLLFPVGDWRRHKIFAHMLLHHLGAVS